jgi:hypothetical protein
MAEMAGRLNDGGAPDGGRPNAPSCSDGIRNGTETGIDCGGDCPPCVASTAPVPFVAGRSSIVGDTTASGWEPADLNGDGKLDVVANGNGFTTALGNGDGVFARTGAFVAGSTPYAIEGHGDFDGDGKDDIVGCFGNNGLRVFRGSATSPSGVLEETTPKFAFGPTSYLKSCATADFNGDGKPDVALGTSSGTVEIALNSGTALVRGTVYSGLTSVVRLIAFDVDGQRGADLLALDASPPRLQLLLSNGDGSFVQRPPATLPTATVDVVPFRETSTFVALLAAEGEISVAALGADGTLSAFQSLGTEKYESVAAGDLDGNGTVELAAARLVGGYVDIYERVGGTWRVKQSVRPNALPRQVRLVDWNRDGRLDLTVLNTSPTTLDVLLNLGDATFPNPPQTALDAQPFAGGAIGDLNGDGRADVLIPVDSIPNQSFIDVYLGQPEGGFSRSAHVALTGRAESLIVGDFTGDGRNDVLAHDSNGQVTLLTGDGAGGLAVEDGFYGPPDALGLGIGDVNADGQDELLIPAPGGIRAYDRSGSWFGGTPHVVSSSDWPTLLAVVDVDGDGKKDLVMSGLFSIGLAWARSLGGYAFDAPRPLDGRARAYAVLPLKMGPLPRRWLVVSDDGLHDWLETDTGVVDTLVGGAPGDHIVRADWNHDGIEDLIVAGAVISLHRGESDGSYTFTGTTLLGGGYANAIGFFDANGDGRKDIVVVNHYGGITVLTGTP